MSPQRLLLSVALAIACTAIACSTTAPQASVPPSVKANPDGSRITSLRDQLAVFERAAQAGGVQIEATANVGFYTPSTARDPQVRGLEDRVGILGDSLESGTVHNKPEPNGDVTDGTYMVFLEHVSAETTPATVVLDFVTDKTVPWATKTDRQRSSWDGWVGWNRFKHSQTFRVDDGAALLDYDFTEPYAMRVVTIQQLEESLNEWQTRAHGSAPPNDAYKFWVTIRRTKQAHPTVWAMWPWERDSSGVK